jgi:hypothetical protein
MSTSTAFAQPPTEDDDSAYLFVDHREAETSIVEYVSERLSPEDALNAKDEADGISVLYRGQTYVIPLQMSTHDRYIMISSLAELLRERYQFFVLQPSLDGDTHGLLVATHGDVRNWGEAPSHLTALDLGYDYFNDIRVPYLNHEASAPEFAVQRERVGAAKNAMGGLIQAMFSGELDANAAAELAKAAMKDPKTREAASGQSEAEMAAEIQKAFNAALASPAVHANRLELDKAMADLKLLTGLVPKPWWKFW